MNNTRFTPARGVEDRLLAQPYTEGMIYFATDSGRIFLDSNGENKIPLGGGGVSIIYGYDPDVKANLASETFILHADKIDENSNPKVGDLIINSDGKFYKIEELLLNQNEIICILIAVSGTNSGGGDNPVSSVIKFELVGKMPNSFIYEKPNYITVKVTTELDDQVNLYCTIVNETTEEYKTLQPQFINVGEEYSFDIGSHLYAGYNKIILAAQGDNSGAAKDLIYKNKNCIKLFLNESTEFNPLRVIFNNEILQFKCVPVGEGLTKTLTVYVDGLTSKNLTKTITSSSQMETIDIPPQPHGMHTIRATLSTGTAPNITYTNELEYQIAWVNTEETTPVIWFNKYPKEIVDHDNLTIEYKVYDPASPDASSVQLYLNQEEVPISPMNVSYKVGEWYWEEWPVVNYQKGTNHLIIKCNEKSEPIEVKVIEDTIRDLDILKSGLHLNLDSKGRSNRENKTSRSNWSYTNLSNETTKVVFNDFNWYNNGWILDENKNSCLRISNGASISIPLSVLNVEHLTHGLTFEFQFKVRNVQNYSTLITTSSTEDADGKVSVIKQVSTDEGVFGKYYLNNIGLCLGTQEAFFRTGNDSIVNARYDENQIVNVTFVCENESETRKTPLIYIYLNGIMSGIAAYGSGSFEAKAQEIVFDSQYCDIDLYKVRVYKAALTSAEVVHNYIADYADAEMYDMNNILSANTSLPRLDFEKILAYNNAHPDNPTMPYAVISLYNDTDPEERLPYVKGGKKQMTVDFVNPSLDRAFEKGDIDGATYLTGCPSFHAEGAWFDVQGTSSQGYPRRNFKGKFKSSDDSPVVWNYTNGPLKGQSLQSSIEYEGKEYKHYYMDNKDASESTFTWKADYMESSGTHNTGFTSFVKTLYSKHPLKDYLPDYHVGDHRTTIYGFPMMVFQKKKDGSYEYVGKYNFNLDKACNNVIDFKNSTQHPYVPGKDFAHVAECWELKNNQGTRCSFKYVNFADVDLNKKLTVLDDFEYRYHCDEDDIDDAIDLKGSFSNRESANEYLLSKYANLEVLCNWLLSTNPEVATGEDLLEPVTYNNIEYTKDTPEYRLAKFENEFEKHFDKEYCEVYFIMTELILGYDSRGKNMMLASWGPQEENGEYIWYPIFYDVDTQLGVNNSGVPSWEYNTNATLENQFSTADSVLWNNFWAVFSPSTKKRYVNLRKNELTIEKLNGFYDFDPKISKSYAMMGCRPLMVYNLDEYYKYIDPAFSGYYDTSGNTIKSSLYFYCLQGTRELQRELFLRNRFNFIDSYWLGGTYSLGVVEQEFKMRYNTSNAQYTSDKFIAKDYTPEELAANEVLRQKYNTFIEYDGQCGVPYKENALDGDLDITIQPYLNQYVSVVYDQANSKIYPYNEDGEPITIEIEKEIPALADSIKNAPDFSQQLVYIGGAEYISSLGDLSLKYIDELDLRKTIRIKDLYLGNEHPDYYNGKMKSDFFELADAATDDKGKPNPQAKQLLETIVLTNISSLVGALDVGGSEKLKTFRALGTNISEVTFADGVQLETLYLPSSINKFELIEPTSLSGILTSKPAINEEGVFPKGLYIEGLTNIGTEIDDEYQLRLNTINLVGGNLNYDSYKLISKAVDIKTQMKEKQTSEKDKEAYTLKINLENIQWTPYRLVEYGEMASVEATYVKLTDHYTFEPYNKKENWDTLTKNGKIYEYNEELYDLNKDVITDLSLLDAFIESYESVENYFKSIYQGDGLSNTLPKVSGNIFVNNDQSISEDRIKNHYNAYYPNLNIFVKNVQEAYTAKFIYIEDNGKETEWDVLKYDPEKTTHPTLSQKKPPEKLHYDFLGWSLEPNGDTLNAEDFNNLIFNKSNPIYTFYAVFTIHKYWVKFKNYNNNPADEDDYDHIMYVKSGLTLQEPDDYVPYKDDSGLELTKTYKFIGYSNEADGSKLVNLNDLTATKNYTLYAVYEEASVYNNVLDSKYFIFNANDDGTGWNIALKRGYNLKGKLTLPIEYNGKPITGVEAGRKNYAANVTDFDNGFNWNNDITHIFWADKGNNSKVTTIKNYAFTNSYKLKYFEFPDSLLDININAFYECSLENNYIGGNIRTIANNAFCNAFNLPIGTVLTLGGSIQTINRGAFSNSGSTKAIGSNSSNNPLTKISIGTSEDKSQLNKIGVDIFTQSYYIYTGENYINTITIYPLNASDTIWETIEDKFGLSNNNVTIEIIS